MVKRKKKKKFLVKSKRKTNDGTNSTERSSGEFGFFSIIFTDHVCHAELEAALETVLRLSLSRHCLIMALLGHDIPRRMTCLDAWHA